MILTGRRMTARAAQGWGFVLEVTAAGETLASARRVDGEIALGAPLALMALKKSQTVCDAMSMRESVAMMRNDTGNSLPIYRKMMESEVAIEGVTAFAEKRALAWIYP